MSSWNAYWSNTPTAAYWTQDQRMPNVDIIYNYFRVKKKWEIAPLAAMVGNMEYESYLNPAQWELGIPIESTGGFGLVQWTPYTKFSNWAGASWRTDYDLQLERIQYELENGIQWIPVTPYNFSFEDFSKMTINDMSVADLTKAFEYCYERGTWDNQRIVAAQFWYQYLKKKDLLRLIIKIKLGEKKQVEGVYLK